MIPVNRSLNLKRAAKEVQEKSIEMIRSKDLLPLTGYVHGGGSPIGMGYEYDEALGDPDHGIAPGTKWEDLPEDFECPLCGVCKDQFSDPPQSGPHPRGDGHGEEHGHGEGDGIAQRRNAAGEEHGVDLYLLHDIGVEGLAHAQPHQADCGGSTWRSP